MNCEPRRALLIFADSVRTDLARRRWPRAFQCLLGAGRLLHSLDRSVEVHLFTSPDCAPQPQAPSRRVHPQIGNSFAERLENAVETMAALGYTHIVVIGQDCPDLEADDVAEAFERLGTHRLVLGPDHRGGCYLIGFHASERHRVRGIQWQKNTDSAALQERFASARIFLLPVKLDVDRFDDIRLLARSRSPWRTVARRLLCPHATDRSPQAAAWVDPRLCRRIRWQLPPPQSFPAPITA